MGPLTLIGAAISTIDALEGLLELIELGRADGSITPEQVAAISAKAKTSDERIDALFEAARQRVGTG